MKEKKMSEPRLSGLNDEQDVGKSKILKSSNHANPDSDNRKEGWEIKRLDDACEVEYGTRVVQKRDGGIIYPVYGGGGATFFMDTFNREDCLVVARFAMSAQCTRFVEGKFFLNDSGLTVRPKNEKELLPDFLNLQILFLNDHIYSLSRGTAQRNLDVPAFRNIQIAFPKSLPEQQRIVSILDEAFSVIERSRNNAEQNLKNAKELFESYLQGVFDPSTRSGQGKGDGWEERRFDEVCVLQRGFDLPTHSRFEGEYPLVSSNGITDRINQWKVKAPGVVTGRSGTIGNVHFIVEDFWPLNTALYIKDFHGNDERFIYYFLTAFDLSKYSSGAGVPTLNRNNVHSVKVRIPKSKTQQQAIVRQLDALRAETQNLEAVYQKKLYDLEELKKSVLRKAFAGEL